MAPNTADGHAKTQANPLLAEYLLPRGRARVLLAVTLLAALTLSFCLVRAPVASATNVIVVSTVVDAQIGPAAETGKKAWFITVRFDAVADCFSQFNSVPTSIANGVTVGFYGPLTLNGREIAYRDLFITPETHVLRMTYLIQIEANQPGTLFIGPAIASGGDVADQAGCGYAEKFSEPITLNLSDPNQPSNPESCQATAATTSASSASAVTRAPAEACPPAPATTDPGPTKPSKGLKDVYSKGSAIFYGLAGGAAGVAVYAGYVAASTAPIPGVDTVTVPTSALVALGAGLVSAASTGIGALMSYLAVDPPDPEYTVLAQPPKLRLRHVNWGGPGGRRLSRTYNALADNSARIVALGRVLLHDMERAQGARLAGAADWERRRGWRRPLLTHAWRSCCAERRSCCARHAETSGASSEVSVR